MKSPYRLIWKLWLIAATLGLLVVLIVVPTAAVFFASVSTLCGSMAGYYRALHGEWCRRELQRRIRGSVSPFDE